MYWNPLIKLVSLPVYQNVKYTNTQADETKYAIISCSERDKFQFNITPTFNFNIAQEITKSKAAKRRVNIFFSCPRFLRRE